MAKKLLLTLSGQDCPLFRLSLRGLKVASAERTFGIGYVHVCRELGPNDHQHVLVSLDVAGYRCNI
jgi:hypothetical protein